MHWNLAKLSGRMLNALLQCIILPKAAGFFSVLIGWAGGKQKVSFSWCNFSRLTFQLNYKRTPTQVPQPTPKSWLLSQAGSLSSKQPTLNALHCDLWLLQSFFWHSLPEYKICYIIMIMLMRLEIKIMWKIKIKRKIEIRLKMKMQVKTKVPPQ